VRILEVDAERRRLSLSLKRVDEGMPIQPRPGEDAAPPTIDLSEAVFSDEEVRAVSETTPEGSIEDEPQPGDDEPNPIESSGEGEPEPE
jgi:hypothetical protein